MSKDGTRPEGWHDDFASDRPERVERQGTKPTWEGGNPNCPYCTGEGCPIEHCPFVASTGFPPETGPDTRQPEMVSREKYDTLVETCQAALVALPGQKNPHPDDALQQLVNIARGILESGLEDAKL